MQQRHWRFLLIGIGCGVTVGALAATGVLGQLPWGEGEDRRGGRRPRMPPRPGEPGHLDLMDGVDRAAVPGVPPPPPGGFSLSAKLSAYYHVGEEGTEAERRREGGDVDVYDRRLYSLQEFLAGRAPYVSVAADRKAFPKYGELIRIKELEERYGRTLLFRVVDAGGAFQGTGEGRLDIRVDTEEQSLAPELNGVVHYARVERAEAQVA